MAHFEEAGFSVVMAVPWRHGRRHTGRGMTAIQAIHAAVGIKARRSAKRVRNEARASDRLVDESDSDFGSVFDHHLNGEASAFLRALRKAGAGANA
jgi:hypothetical protein